MVTKQFSVFNKSSKLLLTTVDDIVNRTILSETKIVNLFFADNYIKVMIFKYDIIVEQSINLISNDILNYFLYIKNWLIFFYWKFKLILVFICFTFL